MRAKPVKHVPGDGMVLCSVEEATHVELCLPGPMSYRLIPIQLKGTRKDTGNWSWNGDTEKPTLHPSILTKGGRWDEDMTEYTEYVCHSFVNDGEVKFLNDCSHEFAGQTLPLLDVL